MEWAWWKDFFIYAGWACLWASVAGVAIVGILILFWHMRDQKHICGIDRGYTKRIGQQLWPLPEGEEFYKEFYDARIPGGNFFSPLTDDELQEKMKTMTDDEIEEKYAIGIIRIGVKLV